MIISQVPNEIGGETAISKLPRNYTGVCEVISINGISVAILPNSDEANKVATYAIKPDGGFGSVEVIKASKKKPTHDTFIDWLMD